MSAWVLAALVSGLVGVIGGASEAMTGFGYALVSVPILSLATGPSQAVVCATISSAAFTGLAAVRLRRQVDISVAGRLLIASLFGVPAGLAGLLLLPDRYLSLGVVCVALVFLVWTMIGHRFPRSGAALGAAGVVSGAALASTGMNGPPLVAAMSGMRMERYGQRATLQAVFVGEDLLVVVAFLLVGEVSQKDLLLALCMTVGAAGGGWPLGDLIFGRIAEGTSRVLIGGVLIAACAGIIVQAV